MDIMTSATLSTYYCTFCDAVKTIADKTFTKMINVCESAGRARAASQLASMGMHNEAKALMLDGDKK